MADHIFQVRLLGSTGLPTDVYENVLCFDVNAPDTVQGRCEDLLALYSDLGQGNAYFLCGYNKVEVRAYTMAGGQPVASAGPTTTANHSAAPMPREVAICLSYAAVDDPAKSTSRRRGRIYLGPLPQSVAADRPGAALLNDILVFGQSLASIGTAGNTTWKLYSRTDAVTAKIESIWVDDAWDTQRRRGLAPTARTVQDVQ